MSNTVYLGEDGFIHSIYEGDQTYESVRDAADQTGHIIKILRQKNQPVKVLIDLTHLGKTHSAARKIGVETLKGLDFDQIAMFGQNTFVKHLVNFIIYAAGKSINVMYFNSKEEAIKWLQ